MNASAQNPSPNGTAQEPEALDKPAGEAAPPREQAERLALQLDRLGRLAEIAMELAEGLTRKAAKIEAGDGEGYEAVCLAFTRLSRAVRQINFQEQEILGLRETVRREERQAREKAEDDVRNRQKALEKRVVHDAVEALLEADPGKDYLDVNKFNAHFDHDYRDYHDLYRGSFEEIIQRICRDMGIDGVEPPPEIGEDRAPDAPLDTPIGKRMHIEAAIERLQSMQGTGPP